MTNRLKSIFFLIRPVNCLITFISVWAGANVAADIFYSLKILVASFSAALITAYGNIINDYFDIETDKINKPYRRLASGLLNRKAALSAAIAMGAAGLALSYVVNIYAVLIAALAILALAVYTPVFKGFLFTGNLIVALVASTAFVYGGLAVGEPFGALVLVFFSFLFHLGREIVKDIEDLAADYHGGRRTGASIDNSSTARVMASGVFGLLAIATVIPVVSGQYGAGYFFIALAGVDSILIYSIIKLSQTDNPPTMKKIAVWLKIAMPLGLLAVFLGSKGL